MKTLFLDCFSGISGDMFLGALIDLGFDLKFLEIELEKLHLPEKIILQSKREHRGSIAGVKFDALLPEHSLHSHDHPYAVGHLHGHDDHEHSHRERDHSHEHGRSYADIQHLIHHSHLSEKVKAMALAIFHRIAVAEAKIHGKTIADVHFHEVGALDSIVDIVGAAVAIEQMGITRVESSPLVEGIGSVQCAHGRFPLPAPATLEILHGVPLRQIEVDHELITPTGAAILAELVTSFNGLNDFTTEKIGYGLGSRNFPDRPNVLRALLGSQASGTVHESRDQVLVLETNLDDATGEELGHLAEVLTQAGVHDVSFAPLAMKKNRPGHLLQVIAPLDMQDKLTKIIFSHSPTFGLRIQIMDRVKLVRAMKTVETPYGAVGVKVGSWEGSEVQIHPEYEDCHRIALAAGVALTDVIREAKNEALKKK